MKPHQRSSKHEFALYSLDADRLAQSSPGAELTFKDEALCARICKVLRLREGEMLHLFGLSYCITGEIVAITQERCKLRMQACSPLVPLKPEILLGVPLLERAAFEAVVAWATVLGIAHVIPYTATKSKRHECAPAERERLRRVMIAAAEQSKQYVLPIIDPVIPLSQMRPQGGRCIVFDIAGISAAQVLQTLNASSVHDIMILCGPEGDWTDDECAMLRSWGAQLCRLTPTILRTEDAVAVGVGMIRSILHRS